MLYNLVIVNPSTGWSWEQFGVAYESIEAMERVYAKWLRQHPNGIFRAYYKEVPRRGNQKTA